MPCLYPGGTIVCLASGPSLLEDDVRHCEARADAVIAVNDTHRLAPWASVLYSSDQHWWHYYQGVPAFAGRKYGIAPLMTPPEWGITVLANTGMRGLDPKPTGLRNGRNSGYAAINLAIHLGATRVVLLGYDMGVEAPPETDEEVALAPANGRTHFFGEHPADLLDRCDHRVPPFDTFIEMYRSLAIPLQQLGVTVLNASRQTALDMFPRIALAEVWP